MTDNQKNFLEKVYKKFGKITQITRQQIVELCKDENCDLPEWLLSDTSYRISRGIYTLNFDNEKPKLVSEFEDANDDIAAEQEALVDDLKEDSANKDISFIPKKNDSFVPFGFFSDLVSILSSDVFYTVFVTGLSGNGKAQPLYSKLKTPTGWITMGEVKLGDKILTQDGSYTKVIGIFPQGEKDVYEVEFSDGRKTHCCGEHLWNAQYQAQNNLHLPISTKELSTKRTLQGFGIPLINPNHYDEDVVLPIDPYVFGCLLGDGSFKNNSITFSSADLDVVQNIKWKLPKELTFNKIATAKYDYRIGCNGKRPLYLNILEDFGLMDKYSYENFIPEIYLHASYNQRLELLQGLMDTDGEATKLNSLHFYTTSEKLRDDIIELIHSLGGSAKFRCTFAPKYVHKGEHREGRPSFDVCFRFPNPNDVFCLNRKKERISESQYSKCNLKFKSITKLGKKEFCQCIMVDHPSHLYVTDNYIVTHNTLMALQASSVASKEMLRVNITGDTDEDDLIGGFRLDNGKTIWQDGPVIVAMKRGAKLLLDEVDLGSNKLMCLQPVLEGNSIYIKKINKIVHPKKGFNIIATANTKGRGSEDGKFIGTQILNEAFLERFSITVEQEYPSKEVEAKILRNVLGKNNVDNIEFVDCLVQWADNIRKTYKDGGSPDLITTRRLVHICKAFVIFNQDKRKAINLCLNRFDEEVKTVFFDLYTKIDTNIDGKKQPTKQKQVSSSATPDEWKIT
jgi:hypothetical protein